MISLCLMVANNSKKTLNKQTLQDKDTQKNLFQYKVRNNTPKELIIMSKIIRVKPQI